MCHCVIDKRHNCEESRHNFYSIRLSVRNICLNRASCVGSLVIYAACFNVIHCNRKIDNPFIWLFGSYLIYSSFAPWWSNNGSFFMRSPYSYASLPSGMREWREWINAKIQLSAFIFFYRQQKMAWNKFWATQFATMDLYPISAFSFVRCRAITEIHKHGWWRAKGTGFHALSSDVLSHSLIISIICF